MNASAWHLRKRDVVVLTLCAASLLCTLGAVGEGGRRRAKETVCQSNLQQWHAVFQGHIQRNGGTFFHGVKGSPGYWWPKELDKEEWDWKQRRIWFCPQADQPMADGRGKLTATTYSIFYAWGIYNEWDLGPNGISGSYGVNGYLINIPDTMRYESGVPASQGWRDLTDVPEASDVPMFLDAMRLDLWPLPTNTPAATEAPVWIGNHVASCCINRHNGGVSCLFVDGSVRKVGLKELWTLRWHRSFYTTGPWTTAGGVQPQDWPSWMREFRDY